MSYTPPVGTVALSIGSVGGYTPPVGTVALSLGHTASDDRQAAFSGETLAPIGLLTLQPVAQAALAGETLPPTGGLTLQPVAQATLAGETLAPTGGLTLQLSTSAVIAGETVAPTGGLTLQPSGVAVVAGETLAPTGLLTGRFDLNLLDQWTAGVAAGWAGGPARPVGAASRWQPAATLPLATRPGWTAATATAWGVASRFQPAPAMQGQGQAGWNPAQPDQSGLRSAWQAAGVARTERVTTWQAGAPARISQGDRFKVRLPLATPTTAARWRDGDRVSLRLALGFGDGARARLVQVEVWQPAGYPGNAPNPGPPIPPVIRPPWSTALRLRCPLPGTRLSLGRTPCVLIPERECPTRRTYMVVNDAALVRWPDFTPLPCTSVTIETDFDSWCWALSATLTGPEAYALVEPNPYACQVQATINGQTWRFLLDTVTLDARFGASKISVKGRSRSAWLHDPYLRARDYGEASPREMVQLAEAALENTGWTLDWNLDNWVVPGGRWMGHNTPIGQLIRLVNATDDGIYTDPSNAILTLHPRWPVASWLLDAATVDLTIPTAAVLSLTQNPIYSDPYNGVYVSGTSHGALALVKIAGTDGALQPAEPITHELLCDEAGVAARRRGLNVLSNSGAGVDLDAETLFTPELGLIRPGLIVSIAGIKGISRSCQITAQWSGDALQVRQKVGLERREAAEAEVDT